MVRLLDHLKIAPEPGPSDAHDIAIHGRTTVRMRANQLQELLRVDVLPAEISATELNRSTGLQDDRALIAVDDDWTIEPIENASTDAPGAPEQTNSPIEDIARASKPPAIATTSQGRKSSDASPKVISPAGALSADEVASSNLIAQARAEIETAKDRAHIRPAREAKRSNDIDHAADDDDDGRFSYPRDTVLDFANRFSDDD